METEAEKSPPKYLQLKTSLLRYLADEGYQAKRQLPTEHALMERFKVSRGTIRQALAELERDGVLYRVRGSGTFFSGDLPGARRLSHLLGVVTPNISFYIYPQIIQGITDAAQQKQYNVVLGSSKTSPGQELGCIEQILAKDIDGLIFEPAPGFQYAPDAKLFSLLKTLPIPIVFMGTVMDDADLSCISVNDMEGGFRAATYLIQLGHRRIACLYPPNVLAGQQRFQGYRNALAAAGIAPDVQLEKTVTNFYSKETPAQTVQLIQELLSPDNERPTAVFCFNDLIAVHVYKALEEAGLNVPDTISLISFDDSDLALQHQVPLTGMIHPKYYLGKWAADLLLEKLQHPKHHFPRHVLITPTLAERASVKAI